MPWNKVNETILRNQKRNFSILKPNHFIDDSFAKTLVEFIACFRNLQKLDLSDINLGDEFAILFSELL